VRLLHTIFAKLALSSDDQRLDLLGGSALADGDQLNIGRTALGERRSLRDLIQNVLASVLSAAHRLWL